MHHGHGILLLLPVLVIIPAGIYLLKANSRNTRTMCDICSKLTKKIPVVLVSLLLTLNIFHTLFYCFYCELWTCSCRLGLCCNYWRSLILWNSTSWYRLILTFRTAKARIHCETFLLVYFMKYSFRRISWNMKCFHEIHLPY